MSTERERREYREAQRELRAAARAVREAEQPTSLTCDRCGHTRRNAEMLRVHRAIAHPAPTHDPPPHRPH